MGRPFQTRKDSSRFCRMAAGFARSSAAHRIELGHECCCRGRRPYHLHVAPSGPPSPGGAISGARPPMTTATIPVRSTCGRRARRRRLAHASGSPSSPHWRPASGWNWRPGLRGRHGRHPGGPDPRGRVEQGRFRLAATIIGVTAGIVIVALLSQTRDLMLAVFAAWVGLCVCAAGVFDGNLRMPRCSPVTR